MIINNFDRRKPLFFLSLLSIIFSQASLASDFQSPRTAALGGAGHASPLLSDSIYLNPSYVSLSKTHSFSANYLTFGGGTVDTSSGPADYYGNSMNISIMDGTPDPIFQAGIGYTRRSDSNMIHVAGSKSFIDRLGVGAGLKFIFPNDNTGERIAETTFAVSGIASSWFQASLIIDNLLQSAVSRGFYREFILGTKFNIMSILLVYLDPHYTPSLPDADSKLGYEVGVEFPFFQDFFLRLGTFKNSNVPYQARVSDGYGLGIGWLAPKLSIDYGISRVLQPISTVSHNFGMSIYF